MKNKLLIVVSITGLLLVGCGNKIKEETKSTTSSTTKRTQSSKKETPLIEESIESTVFSTSSSEDMSEYDEITEGQAIEVASKISEDFKKQIIGTFEDTDTSSSWGSTISITFKEDNSISMTESENSFQKTDLKYKGTYSLNNKKIASNLLETIDKFYLDSKTEKIKECLAIETYNDYNSFVDNADMSYLPITIDTIVNGHKSEEINNEKHSVDAELKYDNLKLKMSYSTRLFKTANQTTLTKK